MRWRIRDQLLAPVVLLLGGIVAISGATAVTAAGQARRQIETRLRDVARFLVEESRFPLTGDVLRQLRTLSGAEYLLVPREGPPLTSLSHDAGIPPDVPVAEDWHTLTLAAPLRLDGPTYLCGGVRLRRGANQGDILYLLYPESLWQDARWQAIRPSLVLGGAVGLTALLLALAQAQRLHRRVQDLERRTRLIATGHFDPMPLPDRDDEIRDLAHSVNEMAGRLAAFERTIQQTERLRLLGQVSGGLAHQLRNGLTGARLAVQLYLRETDAADDREPLEVALRQLTLLETHVRRFLDLGRSGPTRRDPSDLVRLVDDAVELMRPQCRHAGIALSWAPPAQPCVLPVDPLQLGQLIGSLLGNAVEAAGPGGQVEVRLEVAAVVVLEVADSGPGPPASIADRLFEPFVSGKPEGVGLGLAVARQVAEGHGGRIGWCRRDGWTRFRVELPRPGG